MLLFKNTSVLIVTGINIGNVLANLGYFVKVLRGVTKINAMRIFVLVLLFVVCVSANCGCLKVSNEKKNT